MEPGDGYGRRMHPLAIGFWGAFFGAVGLMLLGAAAAFAQVHLRAALWPMLVLDLGLLRERRARRRAST